MAFDLPRLDTFVPALSYAARKKPVEETDPYDSLTDDQKAEADRKTDMIVRQQQLAQQPRSALGEIGVAAQRGAVVGLPQMVGKGIQALTQPGDFWRSTGDQMVQNANNREVKYARDQNEGAHNAVTDAFVGGAEMLAPSLAPLAALPVLTGLGLPAAAATGIAGAAGGALFGASQFQDTYEKAIKAGKTPDEAKTLALGTAAVEGLGETVGTWAGGKFFTGTAHFLPRVLGKKYTTDAALEGIRNPSFLKAFARDFAETAGVETGTEMGQNAGEAAIERAGGIDTTSPYDAAAQAIGPTLAMTALMGPLGALGVRARQRRNTVLLDAIQSPNTDQRTMLRATDELGPQLEPLIGADAVQSWRLDAFERANQLDDAKTEDVQRTLDAQDQANQPPPSQFGVNQNPSQYTNEDDAQQTWDSFASRIGPLNLAAAAQQSETQQQDMFRQLTQSQLPQGVPTFGEFVSQVQAAEGEPANFSARHTARGLQLAYIQHVNEALAQRNQETTGITPAEAAQPQLDLTHTNVEREEPPKPVPKESAPGPTAMQLAMAKATKTAEVGAAETQKAQTTETQKAGEVEALAHTAETTRRVEAANKLADDAMAGKITGNTPVAFEDLRTAWRTTAESHGMDVSVLKGQHLARMESILRESAKQKLWVNQLASLRKARDAMGEGTLSRDTLDALINKVTSYGKQAAPSVSSKEETRQGTSETNVREGQAAVPPEGKPASSNVTTNAAPGSEAVPASPPAPATAPVAAPTREKAGTPVAWGDFSRNVDGTVNYEGKPFPAASASSAPKFAKATRLPLVPDVSQRQVNEEHKYAFEQYHYNSALNPLAGTNNVWLQDYAQAQQDALGFARNRKGELTGKRTQASMMRAQNARDALKWLWGYEGLYDWKADELAQLKQAILDTNTRIKDQTRAYQEQIEDAVRYEYKRKLLTQKLGHDPSESQIGKVELTDKDEKEIARIAKDDPGMEYLHAAAPIYDTSNAIAQAVGTGNLKDILHALALHGDPKLVRELEHALSRMSFVPRIVRKYETSINAAGHRTYGRWSPSTNTITIFDGGENVHTLMHELTHAVTTGMVDVALKAEGKQPGQLRAIEKNALQSLKEVRALMAELEKRGGGKFYGLSRRFGKDRKQLDEKEFIAEVFSNGQFQSWLKGQVVDNRSAWDKIVDWLLGVFGKTTPESTRAFKQALDLTFDFMAGSRFRDASGLSYEHSATAAAQQTDATGSALVQKFDTLLANSTALGTLGDKVRSGFLQMATTFHIGEWMKRDSRVKALGEGMKQYTGADSTKTVLLRTIQQEMSLVTRALNLALPKNTAMNRILMEFAGDMSRHGVDLNKNFDENAKTNKSLDPTLRDHINRRHAEYTRLPAEFKKPLEDSFRIFRKNYIQRTALALQGVLRMHADTSPQLGPVHDSLDLMNRKLDEGNNPKPDFFHDPYSANLDRAIFKAITDGQAVAKSPQDALHSDIAEIAKLYSAARDNPYTHLGRSGDYFMEFNVASTPGAWEKVQEILSPTGKVLGAPTERRHIFLRFENPAQRDELRRVLAGNPSVVDGGIRNGSLFDNNDISSMQGVPAAMRKLINRVDQDFPGAEKAELRSYLKRAYIDLLPDSSAQKALAQRKDGGVPGYDADFMRNYTKRAEGMASMIANQYTLPMYDKAFDTLRNEVDSSRSGDARANDLQNAVFNEMSKRFSNSLSPVESPMIDRAKAIGFNWFLAFSPAFWLTNLMQPYHLTLPFIGGRYGFAATAKEMGRSTSKAMKLIRAAVDAGWAQGMEVGGTRGALMGVLDLNLPVDKTGLSAAEVQFVRRLIESGQLDTTQGHELGRIAAGDSQAMTTTMKVLSAGSHYTEVLNRLTAGLTAFNLAHQRSKDGEKAVTYGIEAVRATQFDYSDHNTGRAWGRHGVAGKVTPLLASFQQYSLQTIELLTRMVHDSLKGETAEDRVAAMKSLGGVMVTTSVLAGTLGLPLANVVAAIADKLLGSGDDPSDVKSAYRSWLADVFGKDVGEAIARGVPRAALGFDTSGRMGLQDVLPGTRFIADRRALKDKLADGALNLLGPAVSAGSSAAMGVDHMMDGNLMDGLIEFLPTALKGPAKAAKMEDQGYTTATGNKLPIDVTPWGVVAQSIGFTPSAKAEQSEANFALRQRDMLLKQQKTMLSNKLYQAIERGEDTTALMQDVALFNGQNPQYHVDVSAGLAARAKARSTAAFSEAGIATLPRYLPLLDRYNYANVR